MLKIKGTAIRATINYIKLNLNEEQIRNLKNLLLPDSLNFFEKPIISNEWYNVEPLIDIMDKVPNILKKENKKVWWEMGRHSCEDGLTTVYRVFYKLGSPEFILKRASTVWNNYYSEGIFYIISHSTNLAHVQIREISFPHPCLCTRISGWMERAIEISGGRNVILKHTLCKFQGGNVEEWKANWVL